MKFKNFTIFILFLYSTILFSQTKGNIIESKKIRVFKAYGYLIGQEYTLNSIKKEHPELQVNILKAEKEFNIVFGKAKVELQNYIKEAVGNEELKKIKNKVNVELKNLLENKNFSQEEALNFIDEVESRAKGNIAPIILETLLSFQYIDSPHEEFLSGFTKIFETFEHSKSKGTNWKIKVPISWKAEEADRPNIIQKFTNDYGSGLNSIMLMVNEIPVSKDYKFTKEELDIFFTEEQMMAIMVQEDSKFISFKKMTIDSYSGGMIEVEQTADRLDVEIKVRVLQYVFIKDNKMYFIMCSISGIEGANIELEAKKLRPLFRLVVNSIVVND